MKIMISWELGGNFGHLTRHTAFAELMHRRGHTVLFAVRDTVVARSVLLPRGLTFISAPQPTPWSGYTEMMRSYADILIFHGMGATITAMPLFEAWEEIFGQFCPDLVVLDHSPAALVVARSLKIPTLEIASGFERPPDITPYPNFRPWLSDTGSDVRNEERVLDVINAYGKRHDSTSTYPNLPSALKANASLLVTFSELDHYPTRRAGRYIGPITSLQDGLVVNWKDNSLPKVFVYLRKFASMGAVLHFLSGSALDAILICPDLSVQEATQMHAAEVQVFRQLVQLDNVLKACDLCISHGGLGLSSLCLLSATKALVIPTNIDQLLQANALVNCGVGLALNPSEMTLKRVETAATLLLTQASYTEASERLAQKYSTYDTVKVVHRLANTAERLAQR
jgi:UDP-N-acetylglucosamine transferase subunit ALG13